MYDFFNLMGVLMFGEACSSLFFKDYHRKYYSKSDNDLFKFGMLWLLLSVIFYIASQYFK